MRNRSLEDLYTLDSDGNFVSQPAQSLSYATSYAAIAAGSPVYDGQTPSQTGATLDGTEGQGDATVVSLTAGITYSFAMRPTPADGIEDPYLSLYGPGGTTLLAQDDDGGFGRSSLLTFTPTVTGNYVLRAGSWVNIFSSGGDTGSYTIDTWNSTGPDAPNTFSLAIAGTSQMNVGTTTFGQISSATDVDFYKIQLTAGLYHEFQYSGGVATGSELGELGGSVATIDILDSNGTVVATGLNYESGAGFVPQQTGTYYVRLTPFSGTTGGYTIDVTSTDLSAQSPLDSIEWDSAANIPTVMVDGVPTAYVYFAPAGMHFGETADDGVSHMVTYGWNAKETQQVMLAFEEYTKITGINYVITNNPADATFRLMTTTSNDYGAYAYPQDPAYGDQAGIVVFNVNSGGWDKPGVSSQNIPGDQVSLDQGGYSFAVILHELGHAHGLSHPHDTGGGSVVMPGVFGSQGTGTYGVFNLNQGVYTVMSYNDAWDFHPNGASAFTIAGIDNGWSGTLGAFDIAAIQTRYGEHAFNAGDNTYTLTDVADDAFYQTIWDTDGTDAIAYSGAFDAQIDLTAATLDYSPTGGGAISFLHNPQPLATNSFLVRGGFTIANGVVIENATGGSGNDILIGNSANNVLDGGLGSDTAVYVHATSGVTIDLVAGTATGGGGNDTLLSIENAAGSAFDDTVTGNAGNNTLEGGAGNDVLDGATGIDTASYVSASGGVTVDLRIAGQQNTSGGGLDTLSGFENLTGSRFNDTLTGTEGDNVINGGAGNDAMAGLGGLDTLSYVGATAAVTANLTTGSATGGAGSDTFSSFENLTGSNFGDTLTGNADDNTILGSFGNDTIEGGDGNDILDGGHGTDRLSYSLALGAVFINLALNTATGAAGTDTITGFENLTGSGHNDALTGTAGANDIVGGNGIDIINAGDGNDVLTGGAGGDTLNGGLGIDTAVYTSAVTVDLAAGTANDGDVLSGIENVTGSSANDVLTGDGSVNVLNGGVGIDTLNGGAGNDTLNGGAGNDILNGGADNDILNGDAGNDTLNGDAGVDTLNGGDGDDMLKGGTGNDRIIGGTGNDIVFGGDGVDVVTLGAGNDIFKAEITPTKVALKQGSMSVDIITDFDAAGNDWIDLSALGTFRFGGTSANNKAGDLTYKTYASVGAAENALGFDIDGQPGASGIDGPVTVVYGNSDGRAPDFAIVLLNTNGIDADDFAAPAVPLAGSSSSIQSDYSGRVAASDFAGPSLMQADYFLY